MKLDCSILQSYSSCVNVSGQQINIKEFFNATFCCKEHLTLSPVIVLNHSNTAFISSQVIIELKLAKYDQGIVDGRLAVNTIEDVNKYLVNKYF